MNTHEGVASVLGRGGLHVVLASTEPGVGATSVNQEGICRKMSIWVLVCIRCYAVLTLGGGAADTDLAIKLSTY